MKKNIAALLPKEIEKEFSLEEHFRAKQIFEWISKGVKSFDKMSNIDKKTREFLKNEAELFSSKVIKTLQDEDGTLKLQILLQDGLCIETVLMTDKDGRKTACVSCQAGCAMNCAFCQTGRLGFVRNLTAAEIVEEFRLMEEKVGRLDNIVFMGMGEPMLNLKEIRKSVKVLTDVRGRALSSRRITISTCGIIRGIYDLAQSGPFLRLAVSLTCADPILRKCLMPVEKENPLSELKKAIAFYSEKTKKRVTLEAVLISGVNTSENDAKKLVEFAKGLDIFINLIPWNEIPDLDFKSPSKVECDTFISILKEKKLNAILRFPRGKKIAAACGQLGHL